MRKIVHLALTLLCVLSSPLLAQSPLADTRSRVVSARQFLHEPQPAGSAKAATAAERRLTVDAAVAGSLFASGGDMIVNDFPIGQVENGDVDLRRLRPIIDAKTQIWIGTEQGDIPGRIPTVLSYRGTIRGEAGSRVFVSLIDGQMYGIIRRADGSSRILAPAPSGRNDAHMLVPESMFRLPSMASAMKCGADRTPNYFRWGKVPFKASVLSDELLEVKIAVEADNSFLQRAGGTIEKATAYVAALFGMVSSMYEDEIDVVFYLPWIKVWSAPDPYQVAGNGYTLFEKAPVYWRANYKDVDRDIAHVLTASEWGGGGVGYRGEGIDGRATVLCSKQNGYSVSSPRGVFGFPTFAFTYDAYIVAHELGHNFGARHTHDCWWNPALDTCYTKDDPKYKLADACHSLPIKPRASSGSIMSYCSALNYDASGGVPDSSKVDLTFTPRVAAVMRQEAELASCLKAPLEATIILTSPRGETREYRDDSLEIVWTSTRITNVTIQYSTNNGELWLDIVSGIPASPESYSWRLPPLSSTAMLIRIADASNPEVADTSLLPFTLISQVESGARNSSGISALEVGVESTTGRLAIEFTLPRPEAVAIALFDNLGSQIAALPSERRPEGRNVIDWQIPSLPSGSYILELRAGAGVATRKLVVKR